MYPCKQGQITSCEKIYGRIVEADNVAEAYLFAQDIIDKRLVVKDKPVHFVIRIEPIEE